MRGDFKNYGYNNLVTLNNVVVNISNNPKKTGFNSIKLTPVNTREKV